MINENKIKENFQSLFVIFFVVVILFQIHWLLGLLGLVGLYVLWTVRKKGNFNFQNINLNFNSMAEVYETKKPSAQMVVGGAKKIFLVLIVIIVGIWLVSSFFVIVGAGETGVISLFGKVRDAELLSGFHFKNPLADVIKMSVRTEEYTMSKAANEGQKTGDDSISALTKEGLSVSLDITTLYHLDQSRASDVYREVGLNFEEKLIRPEIRSAIREVIAHYESKEIYSERRQEAAQGIFDHLNERLEPRGIILEEILVRDVSLPPNIATAIQEKLKAEQESQKYEFLLDREKKEADRKRIEAEGQRDAQRIIDESLSAAYLNYLYIKELKDRPGTIYVPVNPADGMPLFKGIQ